MLLDGVSLFDQLTDSEKATVSLFAQERRLSAWETLFNEGDGATAMYVVKAGSLKSFKDRSTGEQVLGYVKEGEIVGEMAIFDKDAPKHRVATVQAIEPTLLLVIADYAILDLSRKHPEIYEKICSIICERKRKNENR